MALRNLSRRLATSLLSQQSKVAPLTLGARSLAPTGAPAPSGAGAFQPLELPQAVRPSSSDAAGNFLYSQSWGFCFQGCDPERFPTNGSGLSPELCTVTHVLHRPDVLHRHTRLHALYYGCHRCWGSLDETGVCVGCHRYQILCGLTPRALLPLLKSLPNMRTSPARVQCDC